MTLLMRVGCWALSVLALTGAYAGVLFCGWLAGRGIGLSNSATVGPLVVCGLVLAWAWAMTLRAWWKNDAFASIYRWLEGAKSDI